jgi:hypothetical protein
LLLGGCASVQDATGVATQQDLLQLRTDVTVAQQRAQRALSEAETALAQAQRRERERDKETQLHGADFDERHPESYVDVPFQGASRFTRSVHQRVHRRSPETAVPARTLVA